MRGNLHQLLLNWVCHLLFLVRATQTYFYNGNGRDTRVVFPARADSYGRPLPLLFPHEEEGGTSRVKRDGAPSPEDPFYVAIVDSAEELILLQLTPNSRLMTAQTVIEWVLASGRRIVKGVEENCFYSGKDVRSEGPSIVAVSSCEVDSGGLVGFIRTNNQSYFIEPLTKDLGLRLASEEDEEGNTTGSGEGDWKDESDTDTVAELKHRGWYDEEETTWPPRRPHVIYKIDAFKEKMMNLSVDQDFGSDGAAQDFEFPEEDESPSRNLHRLRRTERSSSSKGGPPRAAFAPSDLESLKDLDKIGVIKNMKNEVFNIRKGGKKKKKKRGRRKKRKKRNNCKGNNWESEDESRECLTKREKRQRRKELKEKKRRERILKKKRMRELKRKNRKKKNGKDQQPAENQKSGVVVEDPFANESWEGYSPNQLFETKFTADAASQPGSEIADTNLKHENDTPKWLELTVGVDYTVIDFHGEKQIEKYVFTLFNIVSAIYEDPSLQANLTIVLLRVIFYESETEGQVQEGLAKKSLEAVNRWAETLYRLSAPHLRHDLAVWLTRRDLGGPSGYAPVSGVCDPTRSCTLNRDEGLTSAFIIAHEMGHVLGLSHDGDSVAENNCEPEGRLGSVMAPLVAATFGRFHWSRCSRNEYHSAKKSWKCLKEKPEWKEAKVVSSSIQFQYSLDDQCRMEFGEGFGLCGNFGGIGGGGDPCTFLWCSNASTPHLCKTKKGPPLEGTVCGPDKWCRNGFCEARDSSDEDSGVVEVEHRSGHGEKHTPIRHNPQHGGWSSWTEWGPCSRTCGTGVEFRTRDCSNPPPAWGGRNCVGKREDWRLCTKKRECENGRDARAEQCGQLPSLVRLGRRRSKLQWGPHESKRRRKKCRLACVSLSTNEVFMGKENFIDGTPCSYDDPHSICVQGKCITIGCDRVIGSQKRFDDCGVCGGNGGDCKKHVVSFLASPRQGYTEAAVIPEGAWKILILEDAPNTAFLALKDHDSVFVLNSEGKQEPGRDLISEGTMFHYMRKGERESIHAQGPLLRSVTLMVHRGSSSANEKVSVTISFYTKQQSSKPISYRWRKGPQTPCSATCGGGYQRETVSCEDVRTKNAIKDAFCEGLPKPPLRSIACNLFGCEAKWVAEPWESCSLTCGSHGLQFRVVSCVRVRQLDKFAKKELPLLNTIPTHFEDGARALEAPSRNTFILKNFDDSANLEIKSRSTAAKEESKYLVGNVTNNISEEYYEGNENSILEGKFSREGFEYIDPLLCKGQKQPISERPCNRVPCPSLWQPQGWTQCSVSCGMGQQEIIFMCTSSNEVEMDERADCGKRPREVRACFAGNCTKENEGICLKDNSTFCRLPTLHRYCTIPKYYNLCCHTCRSVLRDKRPLV